MNDTIFGVSLLIVIFLFFGLNGLIPYFMNNFNVENKKWKYWRTLSKTKDLTFVPALFFRGAYVTGSYKGHLLRLDAVYNWKTTFTRTYIHLKSSTNHLTDKSSTEKFDRHAVQHIIKLFYPDLSPSMLRRQKV